MSPPPPFLTITEIMGALSTAGSFFIILTYFIFPRMRVKLFMKILVYIAASDFFANFAYMIPLRPNNPNPWCWIQSFFNLTCYPMSWLWTLTLVYLLYKLAKGETLPSDLRYYHVANWGIPLIQSLGILIFTSYGRVSDEADYEVCLFHVNVSAAVYHAIAYYGLFFGVVIAMLYLKWQIRKLEQSNDTRSFNPTYFMAKMSLDLYPTALLICWLPHALLTVTIFLFTPIQNIYLILYFCSVQLKILHGFATSLIFWYKSRETRRLWRALTISIWRFIKNGCQGEITPTIGTTSNKNSHSFGVSKWSASGRNVRGSVEDMEDNFGDGPTRPPQGTANMTQTHETSAEKSRSWDFSSDSAMDFRDSLLPEGTLMIP